MRHFCDNCAQDFGPFIPCLDYVVHTEKVWLCSLECLYRLEKVWTPKHAIANPAMFSLSHFTEGPSTLDVLMVEDSPSVWTYSKPWNVGIFDFLAFFSVSLAVFWAYVFTLYTLLDSMKGF